MQHNRIKYQENLAAELQKEKINMPAKLIDQDLEDKIKQLEGEKDPSNNPSGENKNG